MIFYQDYQKFLEELRERGVVHIYEDKQRSAEDETLQVKLRFVKRIGEVIRALENRGMKEESGKAEVSEEDLLSYIEEQYRRQDQIAARLGELEKEIALYEPWGHFSKERVDGLAEAGWDLRFFTVPDRKYMPEWEEQFQATVINEQRGQKYFVTVTPAGEQERPDADAFVFPQESEESLRGAMKQLQEEQERLVAHLNEIAVDSIKRLKHYRETISEVADFMQVENASQEVIEEKVMALEGWLPENQVADMETFLQERQVYYEFSAPTPDEDVPVLLKNNKFTRLFEPITEMFALPNYNELDPTPFFAPFFMLFFGLCMGDGGYGLLIWLACFLLARKVAPALKGYLVLGEYLGMATIV
ncbi:MAG: ATPase, partial [Odoribacter sp.]|nr:ATPase [Odoribacter sp.]